MYKADIIAKLKEFPYDKDGWWLITGAAMVLYGMRERTHDIDLGCTKELADELEADGYIYRVMDGGNRWFKIGTDIDAFENWLDDTVVQVDGVPVLSVEGLAAMKRRLGCEKDLRDLALIEAYRVKRPFRLMNDAERDYWYKHLMPEGFERNEIKPRDDVERLLKEDRYEIWGLFPESPQPEGRDYLQPEKPDVVQPTVLPVGFACLWKRPGIPLVLLDYLGVTGALRNGGWGAWMLARLREQGRPLVLESEMIIPGASEEENAIRARRIAFYERNGFHPAYEMATCGMRWQAMLTKDEGYRLEDIMRWHKELYDEKRTDVKVPLGPDEVPELPYWMK